MIPNLPSKTVERLSQYRRVLIACLEQGKTFIYSHELASFLNNTSVQVRRDIMLIGYVGTLRKGYNVKELIERIGIIIDSEVPLNVALVGVGKLGSAILSYFKGKRSQLNIVACFDINLEKIGKEFEGVLCYNQADLNDTIQKLHISIGIITVPSREAANVAQIMIDSGIKGILNYTSENLLVPDSIYLEEYDMVTSLEKVAYFVKHS